MEEEPICFSCCCFDRDKSFCRVDDQELPDSEIVADPVFGPDTWWPVGCLWRKHIDKEMR